MKQVASRNSGGTGVVRERERERERGGVKALRPFKEIIELERIQTKVSFSAFKGALRVGLASYSVTSGRKCLHCETISNCTPTFTFCTFPSNDRLQRSSTLKHPAAHAIAHLDLSRATLNFTLHSNFLHAPSQHPFQSIEYRELENGIST